MIARQLEEIWLILEEETFTVVGGMVRAPPSLLRYFGLLWKRTMQDCSTILPIVSLRKMPGQ